MEHLFSDLETRTMKAKMMDPLNVVISPNYVGVNPFGNPLRHGVHLAAALHRALTDQR